MQDKNTFNYNLFFQILEFFFPCIFCSFSLILKLIPHVNHLAKIYHIYIHKQYDTCMFRSQLNDQSMHAVIHTQLL